MQVSLVTVQILFLFFPGLIGFIYLKQLIAIEKPAIHDWIINSFLIGVSSYALCGMLIGALNKAFALVPLNNMVFRSHFWELLNYSDQKTLQTLNQRQMQVTSGTDVYTLSNATTETAAQLSVGISPFETFFAAILAMFIALFLAWIITKKHLMTIAKKINATNKFGDPSVWHYWMSSPDFEKWVFIRDLESDLTYFGYIQAYSDPGEPDALALSDVSVYGYKSGKHLYNMPYMYLQVPFSKLRFEFPAAASQQELDSVVKEQCNEKDENLKAE